MSEITRYISHYNLEDFGKDGQERLSNSSILIIGVGGLGSAASLYLTVSGVKKLTLVDFDSVDESNLSRQVLFQKEDIGMNKAIVAKRKLKTFNEDILIDAIEKRLSEDEIREFIKDCDLVIDATDNLESRLMINQITYEQRKPLCIGAAIRYEGHLITILNKDKDESCLNCLYTLGDENLLDCEGIGVLSPVVGIMGSMMAMECLKTISGLNKGHKNVVCIFDFKNNIYNKINLEKRVNCDVCS
tara:strand:+ start:880 stop:1614 length:735 start_codon:yes stop_codon:yes gene_type:complete